VTSVGLTLPSFVTDVEVPLRVARAADRAAVDGVFAFDHLFRTGLAGSRRPAIECFALLGACAVETRRVTIGSLVARATLRPPAVLAHAATTVARAAGSSRVIVGIGAGDSQSRAENEEFGLPFGSVADRIGALAASVRAVTGTGLPVWIGGNSLVVRETVALGAAWNSWGTSPEEFAREAAVVRAVAPDATITWGGLVVLATTRAAAYEKHERLRPHHQQRIVGVPSFVAARLRPYVDAGASWLVLGPVDSSNRENADLVAEVKSQLGAR
jgi:alkanesulfonate monooxygenase SsuD/methylene tetrahydromethanopterin reductase-like flavin-dependent oxidoreductase (luciferase family)